MEWDHGDIVVHSRHYLDIAVGRVHMFESSTFVGYLVKWEMLTPPYFTMPIDGLSTSRRQFVCVCVCVCVRESVCVCVELYTLYAMAARIWQYSSRRACVDRHPSDRNGLHLLQAFTTRGASASPASPAWLRMCLSFASVGQQTDKTRASSNIGGIGDRLRVKITEWCRSCTDACLAVSANRLCVRRGYKDRRHTSATANNNNNNTQTLHPISLWYHTVPRWFSSTTSRLHIPVSLPSRAKRSPIII